MAEKEMNEIATKEKQQLGKGRAGAKQQSGKQRQDSTGLHAPV